MTLDSEPWYCKNCPLTNDDCGSWNSKHEFFKNILTVHKHHRGFQKGEPEPKKLSIEILFSDNFDFHQSLHRLISYDKGTTKSCLIEHKPWREVENWEL